MCICGKNVQTFPFSSLLLHTKHITLSLCVHILLADPNENIRKLNEKLYLLLTKQKKITQKKEFCFCLRKLSIVSKNKEAKVVEKKVENEEENEQSLIRGYLINLYWGKYYNNLNMILPMKQFGIIQNISST